ncbi:MAG TPA: VOC family protein [Nocardioidaceae bacterium]|nr:VOC family protein [Nocardioidaceae bacterium]
MAMARFKDLCIGTGGGVALGRFWSEALGLSFEPDEVGDRVVGRLTGPTPQHAVWMNVLAEPRTVKQRVHLDVHTDAVESLIALGASVLETFPHWTVMADPEGGELCAFVREAPPDYRLYEVVVDAVRPEAVCGWWSQVLGAEMQRDAEDDLCWIEPVPHAPFESLGFNAVPEPKTVPNRIHWDVSVTDVQPLVEHGAEVLRRPGGDIDWFVLADPEGNEFCAFVE